MDRSHRHHYLAPYDRAVKERGSGFAATLWKCREWQALRFEVMAEMASFHEEAVIVDAGCGTGDFAHFLHKRGMRFARYIGIDAMPVQIEAARARSCPNAEFVLGDYIVDPGLITSRSPHFVCFCGSLNTLPCRAARRIVEVAFRAAGEAVAFNFLSTRSHPAINARVRKPGRRFNPAGMVHWALGLTPCVALRHDYLGGHDATIIMRRSLQAKP